MCENPLLYIFIFFMCKSFDVLFSIALTTIVFEIGSHYAAVAAFELTI